MAGRPLRRLRQARNPDGLSKAQLAWLRNLVRAVEAIGPSASARPWKYWIKVGVNAPYAGLTAGGYIEVRDDSDPQAMQVRLRQKGYFLIRPEKYDAAKAAAPKQPTKHKPTPPSPYSVPVDQQQPVAASKPKTYPWWKPSPQAPPSAFPDEFGHVTEGWQPPHKGKYGGKGKGKGKGKSEMFDDEWGALFGGQAHPQGPPKPYVPPEPKFSFGIVLIRGDGKIQLREPMGHFDGYCVPLDTEVLTRTGWKHHDEVSVGDETIGFNPETETSQWTKITAIQHFRDRPVVRYGNEKLLSVQCTPDHRWLAVRRGPDGPEWVMMEAQERLRGHSSARKRQAQKLVLSVKHDDAGSSDINPDEAALLAWIVTDGCMSAVNKSSWECSIGQKKQFGIDAIEGLLARMDFPHTKRVDYGGHHTYRLQAHGLRRLMDRTGYTGDKASLLSIVLSMSTAAVQAFHDAAYLAEGSSKGLRNCMWQNEGPCLDALQVAAYRVGYFPAVRDARLRPRIKRLSLMHPEIRDIWAEPDCRADVWCVTTDLGTWTMRQGNYVCLTGNCWTFAKGGQDPGETPEQTALREVQEETGWTATILVRLPEDYAGFNATTSFFLGKPGEQVQPPDQETAAVEWFTEDEARARISLTQNIKGRSRDLAVLCSAYRAWERLNKPAGA